MTPETNWLKEGQLVLVIYHSAYEDLVGKLGEIVKCDYSNIPYQVQILDPPPGTPYNARLWFYAKDLALVIEREEIHEVIGYDS